MLPFSFIDCRQICICARDQNSKKENFRVRVKDFTFIIARVQKNKCVCTFLLGHFLFVRLIK